jgi:putative transposase
MILVERHQYLKSSKHFNELDHLCFLAKNLYNVSLYYVRKHFFNTKEYLNYSQLNKMSNELFANDYQALPRKVSQQIQKLVDFNFKSFFNHLKVRKPFEHINIPNYLDKVNGRQVLIYTKQSISFNNRNVPQDYIKLSGVSFLIKTKVQNIQFARIVPNRNYITIEIGYKKAEKASVQNNNYASIDIGVNNLATVTSNVFKPIIINGKPLKSINQFYNKRIANLSYINKNKWSNKMYSITRKRNNKINDYMHKSSTYIVNHLVSNNVGTLVIGHNKNWKQDTNMRKDDKQTFIQIPFNKFIQMLEYKCQLKGIQVVKQEESYTSKCNFLQQDYIPTFNVDDNLFKPTGKRIKRGLYKSNCGKVINADVNGSYNILRKYLTKQVAWNENIFSNCVEVCSTPTVFTVKT